MIRQIRWQTHIASMLCMASARDAVDHNRGRDSVFLVLRGSRISEVPLNIDTSYAVTLPFSAQYAVAVAPYGSGVRGRVSIGDDSFSSSGVVAITSRIVSRAH